MALCKYYKKLLTWALCLAMLLSLTPAATAADAEFTEDDIQYTILDAGTVAVCGMTDGSATLLSVPDTVEHSETEYAVVSVSAGAFQSCTSLIGAEFGCNVKTIGDNAFFGCVNLKNVDFASKENGSFTLESFGTHAFDGCPIEDMYFPASLKTIGDYAFHAAAFLYIDLSESSVATIGSYAFADCTELFAVDFPETLKTIGDHAFSNTILEYLEVPESVEEIKEGAFLNCETLQVCEILGENTQIGSHAIGFSEKTEGVFEPAVNPDPDFDPEFAKLVIECPTESKAAVYGSENQIETAEPQPQPEILEIDDGALIYEILDGEASVIDVSDAGVKTITVPSTVRDTAAVKTYRVRTLGSSAFENCTALESVTIPQSVTEVESMTFKGCTALERIVLESKTLTIGDSDYDVFSGCAPTLTVSAYANSVWTVPGEEEAPAFSGSPADYIKTVNQKNGTNYQYEALTVSFSGGGSARSAVAEDVKPISFTSGGIYLEISKEAVNSIAAQMPGGNITAKIQQVKPSDYADKIDAALLDGATAVQVTVKAGNTVLHSFGGATLTLSIPVDAARFMAGKQYQVIALNDDGSQEMTVGRCAEKDGKLFVEISTNHLTVFVVSNKLAECSFSDISVSDYYFNAVLWAAEKDITKGTSETTFSPNDLVTRAQVVTFLWRAAGCPVVNYYMNMSDVKSGEYYTEAVRWAFSEGITKGTSATTFDPDAICTRGQIVTFLARFAGVADDATGYTHGFTDVKAADYFNNAVAWAKDNKVTEGTSATTFSPNEDCTRAQVVTFLYRWMVK